MKALTKKGEVFSQLSALAVGVGAIAIVLVVIFLVLSQAQSQIRDIEGHPEMTTVNGSAAFNATVEITDAVDDIPGWLPLIILTMIGSILIGMVSLFKR